MCRAERALEYVWLKNKLYRLNFKYILELFNGTISDLSDVGDEDPYLIHFNKITMSFEHPLSQAEGIFSSSPSSAAMADSQQEGERRSTAPVPPPRLPRDESLPSPGFSGLDLPEASEERDLADGLLGALRATRGKPPGKTRRISSDKQHEFDIDSLTFTERALLLLVDRCLEKMSSLERSVKALNPTGPSKEVSDLRLEVSELRRENTELKEAQIEQQTRSMKENLLFHGIPETEGEDTSETIKTFLKEDLGMRPNEVDTILISTSHRLGKKRSYRDVLKDGKKEKVPAGPRPIVVRFVLRDQRNYIRYEAPKKLRNDGKNLRVTDHFPTAVVERRRILTPIMQANYNQKKKVRLVADKLYINDVLYTDDKTVWISQPVS